MKRIVSVLLCLLMLELPACAEDVSISSIAAIMARQTSANSTLRMQLTAELSEQPASFADELQWQTLAAILPGLSLESAYVLSRAGETLGNSQLSLYLKREKDKLSTMHVNGRGNQWQVWGDALDDMVLTAPRDTEILLRNKYLTLSSWAGVLLRDAGLIGDLLGDQTWPNPLRGALEGVSDAEWQEKLTTMLRPHETALSAWLQAHTTLKLIRGTDGSMETVAETNASMSECAQEAAAMLRGVYADEALLDLLRERLTEEEALYLEPGMIRLFEPVLLSISGEEKLTVLRRYGSNGELRAMDLSLPLADGHALKVSQADGKLELSYGKEEPEFHLTAEDSAESGWQGEFLITYGEKTRMGSYQLFASLEPQTLDRSGETPIRRQNGTFTLLIEPAEGQSFMAQSLILTLTARAGEGTTQPARWYLEAVWQEKGGAYVRTSLKLRTDSLIAQTEAQGRSVSLAELSKQEREALVQRMLAHLTGLILPRTED